MFRPCLRSLRARNTRLFSSTSSNGVLTKRTAARVTLLTVFLATTTVFADSDVDTIRVKDPSLGSFVRAYSVYAMCSVPALVDASPRLLSFLTSIPGIKQITEAFVRITFFDQFVGGDTLADALPLLRSLRSTNKGVLLAYSVEVDEKEATGTSPSRDGTHNSNVVDTTPPHKRIIDETLHCIDVAANLEEELESKSPSVKGKRTWVAIKLSALLPDASALLALSSFIVESSKKDLVRASIPFPGTPKIEDLDVILKTPSIGIGHFTSAQVSELVELYDDLVTICTHAQKRGIKIIVDAEYSWYQPAIDALTMALMRKFNSLDVKKNRGQVQPLVYGTFQAYLRRTRPHLFLALVDAHANNYALGVKLVRGAYHPHEIAAHEAVANDARPSMSISTDVDPPVWLEKEETDKAYNWCLNLLMRVVKEDVERCEKAVPHTFVERISDVMKKTWYGLFAWGGAGNTDIGRAAKTDKRSKTTTTALPLPSIGVLFGTHNSTSCQLILQELVDAGLAVISDRQEVNSEEAEKVVKISDEAVERIAIGQLYGMDDLTDWVMKNTVSSIPFVIKYVPYGALADVLPYLSRRAIENKSILGDGRAIRERQRAGREIWKRMITSSSSG